MTGAAQQVHQLSHRAEILQPVDRGNDVADMRRGNDTVRIGAEFFLDLSTRQRILECAKRVLTVTGSKSQIRYEPLPPDDPIPGTAVELDDRQPHQCCWPLNRGDPFLFCGVRKAAGHRQFCPHHAKRARRTH